MESVIEYIRCEPISGTIKIRTLKGQERIILYPYGGEWLHYDVYTNKEAFYLSITDSFSTKILKIKHDLEELLQISAVEKAFILRKYDSKLLIRTVNPNSLKILDLKTKKIVYQKPLSPKVSNVIVSFDGYYLVAESPEQTTIVQLKTFTLVKVISGTGYFFVGYFIIRKTITGLTVYDIVNDKKFNIEIKTRVPYMVIPDDQKSLYISNDKKLDLTSMEIEKSKFLPKIYSSEQLIGISKGVNIVTEQDIWMYPNNGYRRTNFYLILQNYNIINNTVYMYGPYNDILRHLMAITMDLTDYDKQNVLLSLINDRKRSITKEELYRLIENISY